MENTRNVVVIVHVSYSETAMADELLKQSGAFSEREQISERVIDSNDVEKERGIIILSKNTAINYKGIKINVIDTPGHTDFGGEVERVLKMIGEVLLLVDAQEGVMPQTKFVIKKAPSLGLEPMAVTNKIDKPAADPGRVINKIFDLFVTLDANNKQPDLAIVYAAVKSGYAKLDLNDESDNMEPLFKTILKRIPAPSGTNNNPLQLQVFTLGYDSFVDKIGIARIFNGVIKKNQSVIPARVDGTKVNGGISKLIGFMGLGKTDIEETSSGDIIAIASFEALDVGDSVIGPNNPMPFDPLHIEEPTLSVIFSVSDGPLAGTERKHVASNKVTERLEAEMKTNIAMKYENTGEGKLKVSSKGELQITILAKNIRREGFEFCMGGPEVIVKIEDRVKIGPFEHLVIDVPGEFSGTVIEKPGKGKAEMKTMAPTGDKQTRLEFEVPARGLIGSRSQFLTNTEGEGAMGHSFLEFRPFSGAVEKCNSGTLIPMEDSVALRYSLFGLQERGVLFIEPQTKVYTGMIIGEHSRPNDLDVNPVKGRNLTSVRASGSDGAVKFVPPRKLNLEEALEWIEEDELIEVTPRNVHIREHYLDPTQRKRMEKAKS